MDPDKIDKAINHVTDLIVRTPSPEHLEKLANALHSLVYARFQLSQDTRPSYSESTRTTP